MINHEFQPYLRDGVDVYVHNDESLTFVFLSTRKRIQLRSHWYLVDLLHYLDGNHPLSDLVDHAVERLTSSGEKKDPKVEYHVHRFIEYLSMNNIVVDQNWYQQMPFDTDYKERVKKQLHFLMDILPSMEEVFRVQNKIKETRIAIMGMGAVGSWVLIELLGMGFLNFKLFDFSTVKETDRGRHAYYSEHNRNSSKVKAYCNIAHSIAPDVSITGYDVSLSTDFDSALYLDDVDLIVNCADEPYIGYTSIYLSRYCVKHNKLLFVAGGFDAHLGSLGEMVIPYKTPCSDCYDVFFKKSLRDWNPIKHPIKNRARAFGGLNSLAIFSASSAALQILRLFATPEMFLETANRRSEFLFDNYTIESLEVSRNPNCKVCGENIST